MCPLPWDGAWKDTSLSSHHWMYIRPLVHRRVWSSIQTSLSFRSIINLIYLQFKKLTSLFTSSHTQNPTRTPSWSHPSRSQFLLFTVMYTTPRPHNSSILHRPLPWKDTGPDRRSNCLFRLLPGRSGPHGPQDIYLSPSSSEIGLRT